MHSKRKYIGLQFFADSSVPCSESSSSDPFPTRMHREQGPLGVDIPLTKLQGVVIDGSKTYF